MADKMYCPRCTRPFGAEEVFCRDCGLSLGGVAQIVTGEAESAPETWSAPNPGLMRAAFGLFILGLLIALGNAVLTKLLGFSQTYGIAIFLLFIMAALALLGAGVLFPQRRFARPDEKGRSRRQLDGTSSVNTARLQEPIDVPLDDLRAAEAVFAKGRRPSSVTENTTRDLA